MGQFISRLLVVLRLGGFLHSVRFTHFRLRKGEMTNKDVMSTGALAKRRHPDRFLLSCRLHVVRSGDISTSQNVILPSRSMRSAIACSRRIPQQETMPNNNKHIQSPPK